MSTLAELGILQSVVMTDGWHFPQQLRGQEHRIEGGDGDELVRKVLEFRLTNGIIPIGDVPREIAEYVRRVSPQNYRFRDGWQPQQPRTRAIQPLIERIRQRFADMAAKGAAKLVDRTEAERRAEICRACPMNVEWRTSCGECNQAVESDSFLLRQGNQLANESRLRGCRLHGFEVRAAAFVDRARLPEAHEKAPDFCWMK